MLTINFLLIKWHLLSIDQWEATVEKISRYGPKATSRLIAILNNENLDYGLREPAAEALGRIDTPDAAEAVSKFIDHHRLRSPCIDALRRMNNESAKSLVREFTQRLRNESENVVLLVTALHAGVEKDTGLEPEKVRQLMINASGSVLSPVSSENILLEGLPLWCISGSGNPPTKVTAGEAYGVSRFAAQVQGAIFNPILPLFHAWERPEVVIDLLTNHDLADIYFPYDTNLSDCEPPFLLTGNAALSVNTYKVVVNTERDFWKKSADIQAYLHDSQPKDRPWGLSEYEEAIASHQKLIQESTAPINVFLPVFVIHEEEEVYGALRLTERRNEQAYGAELLLTKPIPIAPGNVLRRKATTKTGNFTTFYSVIGTITDHERGL
ncbi:MAG: HEAT repeat domain-containing protein [Armatimonadota bacterium]